MAAEDLVRSHPFAFKKDSILGSASINCDLIGGAQRREGGEGCAIIILPPSGAPAGKCKSTPRLRHIPTNVLCYGRVLREHVPS
jgi:hypothetical protein